MGRQGLLQKFQIHGIIVNKFMGADDNVQRHGCKRSLGQGENVGRGVGYNFIFHEKTSLEYVKLLYRFLKNLLYVIYIKFSKTCQAVFYILLTLGEICLIMISKERKGVI